MQEKYPELTEKCKSCMGCNKLADITFKGYYRCENYMKGAKDELSTNNKDQSNRKGETKI